MPFDLAEFSILDNIRLALTIIYQTAFIWLPVVTITALFRAWLNYKRAKYWESLGYKLLEIKLPKEILKSPVAMEIIMAVFSQGGDEKTWIDRLWKGKTRDWFSLELVSLEGKIKFYIWTRPKYKNIIETTIYSQFPTVEIFEVPDYTLPFSYDPEKIAMWGCEWALTKADPFPIKTYVDYGLEGNPKEEVKIDPITPLIEYLGTLTAGNYAWIQIIIRQHKKEQRKKGTWFEVTDAWKDEADAEIKKLIDKSRFDKDKPMGVPLNESEKAVMKALDRSTSKLPFDVGMRTLYLAEKDKFNGSNIAGLLGSFKQFGSPSLNGFKPTGGLTGFDYPWQDYSGKKREKIKKRILEAYKSRHYFFPPYKGKKPFVLNTEELATIYHFPGSVASTPTFERIPSKKSEAPFNLPT